MNNALRLVSRAPMQYYDGYKIKTVFVAGSPNSGACTTYCGNFDGKMRDNQLLQCGNFSSYCVHLVRVGR